MRQIQNELDLTYLIFHSHMLQGLASPVGQSQVYAPTPHDFGLSNIYRDEREEHKS